MMTFDSTIADFDGKLIVTSSQTKTHFIGKIIKRIIDIMVGILGVLSLIPLSVIIKVISLKNGDHASIFFTQDRIGKDGKRSVFIESFHDTECGSRARAFDEGKRGYSH